MDDSGVNVINRDANNINGHVLVSFEDVLAEPDGVRSLACVWKLSYCCFNFWKGFFYKVASLVCGPCYAMCWGCAFAQIAFSHVWCFTPLVKMLQINCVSMKKMLRMCLSCCLDPLCESFGMIFHHFNRGGSLAYHRVGPESHGQDSGLN